MVSHWRLSDSKSPKVSRTFLTILAHHTNPVVRRISARPPIFNSFSTLTIFFFFLAKSKYLSLFSFSLIFALWYVKTAKFTIRQVLFFCFCFLFFYFFTFYLLTITRSGLLVRVRWSVYIFTKFVRILCVSFFKTDSCLCIYHLVVWSNFTFLHNSLWITVPNQSCLVFFFFFFLLLLLP